jgi:hypothetical protein
MLFFITIFCLGLISQIGTIIDWMVHTIRCLAMSHNVLKGQAIPSKPQWSSKHKVVGGHFWGGESECYWAEGDPIYSYVCKYFYACLQVMWKCPRMPVDVFCCNEGEPSPQVFHAFPLVEEKETETLKLQRNAVDEWSKKAMVG